MPEINDRDIDLTNDNEELELEEDQQTDDQSVDDKSNDDDSSDSDDEESKEDLKAQLGRLKRELKKAQRTKQKKTSSSDLSPDEVRLYARHDDDAVEKIRRIAKVEGMSLTEAEQSDYFSIYQKKREQEETARKASLGSSKGGRSKSKKVSDASLSEEDHKALARKRFGN